MNKQIIIINTNGKPTELCEVKTIKSLDELDDLKKVCETNKAEVIQLEKKEKADVISSLSRLLLRCSELENRIKKCELELKYNRGEITETEYEELCLGIK